MKTYSWYSSDNFFFSLFLDKCMYIFYSWFDGSIELDRKWIEREGNAEKNAVQREKIVTKLLPIFTSGVGLLCVFSMLYNMHTRTCFFFSSSTRHPTVVATPKKENVLYFQKNVYTTYSIVVVVVWILYAVCYVPRFIVSLIIFLNIRMPGLVN